MVILSTFRKWKETVTNTNGDHEPVARWTRAEMVDRENGLNVEDSLHSLENPNYNHAIELSELNNEEDYRTAFGKIAKAVSVLKDHVKLKSIVLDGDVDGSVQATGSDNITIHTTVNDNSHNHTVSNISDLTASASELNVLDGITASTQELNYTDGVTSNIQTQLNTKAPINNPAFTGTPTAPTAPQSTNTTQVATTAYVRKGIDDHNTSSTAHNDIRNLISGLTTRLNALADSDDTTLDQLSEIVAYIKSNRTLIENVTTNKINVSDIINNLTSTTTNQPLSAAQGKVLKDLIDNINTNSVAINDQTPTFSQASARTNIVSGEKLSVIFGKIAKWFADLKTVAFTGSYNDLVGKPTKLSAFNNDLKSIASSGTAKWVDAPLGFSAYKYEGQDVSTYTLPSTYCCVFVYKDGNTRGIAYAIAWNDNNNGIMWINRLHGSWRGWYQVNASNADKVDGYHASDFMTLIATNTENIKSLRNSVNNLCDITGISFDSAFGHSLSVQVPYVVEIGLGSTSPPNYCLKYNEFLRDEYGDFMTNEIGGIVYVKGIQYLLRYKIVRNGTTFNSTAEVVDTLTGNVTQSESKTFSSGYGYIIQRAKFGYAPKFSARNGAIFYEKDSVSEVTPNTLISLLNNMADENNKIIKIYTA